MRLIEVSVPPNCVIPIDLDAGPQPHDWPEFALLGALVRAIQPKIVVEVGVMYGQTTVYLAQFLPPDGVIYGLDLRPEWSSPLLAAWGHIESAKRITIIGGDSNDTIRTLPDGIEFAFVDGDHSYDSVRNDVDLLWPKMVGGAVMAIHDCAARLEWTDVCRFVTDRFPHAIRFEFGEGLALVQKR
ncbi:MAG TPA: class I SAM-dependent methyltransferase [Anaerolineales bacterium]